MLSSCSSTGPVSSCDVDRGLIVTLYGVEKPKGEVTNGKVAEAIRTFNKEELPLDNARKQRLLKQLSKCN